MLKRITIKKIMSWHPCYTEKEIRNFFKQQGLKNSATPLQIAQCGYKRKEDIVWLLLSEEIIPETELHKLACTFAETALKRERKAGREPSPVCWNAIKVKRLWIAGKATDEQLAIAQAAAQAWAARARAAAGAATEAAAGAARAAAWAAARAARAAAWAAAGAAAWAAVYKKVNEMQLKIVIKILLKYQ